MRLGLLAATGLSLFLSSRREFRIDFSGLSIPAVLVPIAVLGARIGMRGVRLLPHRLVRSVAVFSLVFSLAVLSRGPAFDVVVKVVGFTASVVIVAAATKSKRDFVVGVAAFVAAIFAVSCASLADYEPSIVGLTPLDTVGNKNAFSLYALPALLLGLYVVTGEPVSRRVRSVLLPQLIVIALTVFATNNRSGWLGAAIIPSLLLISRRRIRDAVVVAVLGLAVILLMGRLGFDESFQFRVQQTQESDTSDQKRQLLVTEALHIGTRNPILGVGPQHVADELGAPFARTFISPHNFFTYIWAGGGSLLSASFVLVVHGIWTTGRRKRPGNASERLSLSVAQMMLLLFLIRGWYSEEVLFSPAFAIGIGLAVGLAALSARVPEVGRTETVQLAAVLLSSPDPLMASRESASPRGRR